MNQKFISPTENEDLKKFMGSVLTLLGEVISNQNQLSLFLKRALYFPEDSPTADGDDLLGDGSEQDDASELSGEDDF